MFESGPVANLISYLAENLGGFKTVVVHYYWVGMLVFMVHFSLVCRDVLFRKKVVVVLCLATLAWPLVYVISFLANLADAYRNVSASEP